MAKVISKKTTRDPYEAMKESLKEALINPELREFKVDVTAEMNFTFTVNKDTVFYDDEISDLDDEEIDDFVENMMDDLRSELENTEPACGYVFEEGWTCYADIKSGGVM